jgi:hypothetical protein
LICVFSACEQATDETVVQPPAIVNVVGTWVGQVHVDSCSPTALCEEATLPQQGFVGATLILNQKSGKVLGRYLYGKDVDVTLEGSAANPLVLKGFGPHHQGSIEVRLTGDVNEIRIFASIGHKVSLKDGRSALVGGTGDFRK